MTRIAIQAVTIGNWDQRWRKAKRFCFHAEVTRQAQQHGLLPKGATLWQRNFWDRIVRDERELATVRAYIESNPARWLEDQLHPQAGRNKFNRTWGGRGMNG
jgi:REP element-mobilizing transposase RayT